MTMVSNHCTAPSSGITKVMSGRSFWSRATSPDQAIAATSSPAASRSANSLNVNAPTWPDAAASAMSSRAASAAARVGREGSSPLASIMSPTASLISPMKPTRPAKAGSSRSDTEVRGRPVRAGS